MAHRSSMRAAVVSGAAALAALASGGCAGATHCSVCKLDVDSRGRVWPIGDHRPNAEPGRHLLELAGQPRRIVPAPGLPEDVDPLPSNNNLDVLRHRGKTLLAFRSAPSHYASRDAIIYVLSSEDEQTWTKEAAFNVNQDLREPRLLENASGEVLLYVSTLGVDEGAFEPSSASYSVRSADGRWSNLTATFCDGRVVWRTKQIDGTSYMSYYVGGGNIYRPLSDLRDQGALGAAWGALQPLRAEPVAVRLATSVDGRSWQDVATLREGGASETAFTFDEAGMGYAVMRVELAEMPGGLAGSAVCRTHGVDHTAWKCRMDQRKFDSPLMFTHDGEVYLIARRSLAQQGRYATGPIQTTGEYAAVQARYSCAAKRCAVWRYVKGEDRIAWLADLPSMGDTCFPGVIRGATADELVVYDYSAPLNSSTEQRWCEAQENVTHIYRHVLRFSRRPGVGDVGAAASEDAG